MQATAVQDAFVPMPVTTPDGVRWLQLNSSGDIYDHFASLPAVVLYNGRYYQKMSHNSDTYLIHYKEIKESQIAFKMSKK